MKIICCIVISLFTPRVTEIFHICVVSSIEFSTNKQEKLVNCKNIWGVGDNVHIYHNLILYTYI